MSETPTIPMTPTATGVPTEPAPEPLQNATYLYDGDGRGTKWSTPERSGVGNLVKSVVNSREANYLGNSGQKVGCLINYLNCQLWMDWRNANPSCQFWMSDPQN